MRVSVADLKKNYGNLNVSFDIWLGESDAQPYIPPMIEQMKRLGLAEESEGALVVPVALPEDTKEVPPLHPRQVRRRDALRHDRPGDPSAADAGLCPG